MSVKQCQEVEGRVILFGKVVLSVSNQSSIQSSDSRTMPWGRSTDIRSRLRSVRIAKKLGELSLGGVLTGLTSISPSAVLERYLLE